MRRSRHRPGILREKSREGLLLTEMGPIGTLTNDRKLMLRNLMGLTGSVTNDRTSTNLMIKRTQV